MGGGRRIAVALLLELAACSDDALPSQTVSGSGAGAGGGGGAGGAAVCSDPAAIAEPPAASTDWCARFAAGAPGARSIALDLSAAHAEVRFFAPHTSYLEADVALAEALDGADGLTAPDLAAYPGKLPGVACAPAAGEPRALGPARVTPEDGLALIAPGTGEVTLPAGAGAVVIDLRGLPADESLAEILDAAVAPALATPVPRSSRRVREHSGMTDEVFSATNVYADALKKIDAKEIPASGTADLPIVLLTEAVMPPAAVELAGDLRLARRAWIYGEDLRTEVAEARWAGVGGAGIAHRTADLLHGTSRWPDVIPADRRAIDPSCLIRGPDDFPTEVPPEIVVGADDRPAMKTIDPFGMVQPESLSIGGARAALLISHGAVRLFYPFAVPELDARLAETLGAVDDAAPLDHQALTQVLHRFGAVLDDGHNFVFNPVTKVAGYFTVQIEDIAGEPVVRRSATPGVAPGDTITSIGGVLAADWYKEELARTSAASDGYRFNLATRRYLAMQGPTDFGLRDPDGATKVVTVEPVPYDEAFGFTPSLRQAGPLTDLGAPTLYYINLSDAVLTSIQDFRTSLQDAELSTGLVLDMRGYPGIDHYEVAQRIVNVPFHSPQFHLPVLTGPDAPSVLDAISDLAPESNPSFGGPVVLLVGHITVSAAENFSTMLVDADRVTVVGRASAATNGNITGVQLPGQLGFSFTGMVVKHADGSPFIGIGIVPDVEVPLTAAAFRDGIDPELAAAIDVLAP